MKIQRWAVVLRLRFRQWKRVVMTLLLTEENTDVGRVLVLLMTTESDARKKVLRTVIYWFCGCVMLTIVVLMLLRVVGYSCCDLIVEVEREEKVEEEEWRGSRGIAVSVGVMVVDGAGEGKLSPPSPIMCYYQAAV